MGFFLQSVIGIIIFGLTSFYLKKYETFLITSICISIVFPTLTKYLAHIIQEIRSMVVDNQQTVFKFVKIYSGRICQSIITTNKLSTLFTIWFDHYYTVKGAWRHVHIIIIIHCYTLCILQHWYVFIFPQLFPFYRVACAWTSVTVCLIYFVSTCCYIGVIRQVNVFN